MKKPQLKPRPRRTGADIARLLFFLFVTLGAGLVFILTPDLFPSALISVILYFIFRPIVDAGERHGISRATGIAAIFVVFGVVVALGVGKVVPRISTEIEAFQAGNTRYASDFTAKLQLQEDKLLGAYPMFKDMKVSANLMSWLQNSADKLWTVAPNFASQLLICLFLVPFLTFVLLRDGREIQRALLRLVPNHYFETAYSLMFRIMDGMGGFVAARIIEAVLVTALVAAGCMALGIPYALLLGVFAGATNPIPYLGPLLGAIPGIAIAILDPAVPNQLVWVVLIYAIANLIDMVVIFPVVVAKIVDLHPVIVVVSVILGSQLFGVLGMIVAVPLTSILKIFIQEIYTRVYDNANTAK